MNQSSIIAVFLASLIGSLHCVGMCGGFVTYYTGKTDQPLLSHVGYNFGRLITYFLLGSLAAIVGASIDDFGLLVGIQRFVVILTGILLLYWGLKGLLGVGTLTVGKTDAGRFKWVIRVLPYRMLDYVLKSSTLSWPWRSLLLGVVSTLLPCGWLYSFLVLAAASADVVQAVLIMFLFWLGTLPALVGIGTVIHGLCGPLRQYIPRVTALLLLFAGGWALSSRSLTLTATKTHAPAGHCPFHSQGLPEGGK